jgi:hypothetical protein
MQGGEGSAEIGIGPTKLVPVEQFDALFLSFSTQKAKGDYHFSIIQI